MGLSIPPSRAYSFFDVEVRGYGESDYDVRGCCIGGIQRDTGIRIFSTLYLGCVAGMM